MMHVEPSFVVYALRLDLGCCLRAHIVLCTTGEPMQKKRAAVLTVFSGALSGIALFCSHHFCAGAPMRMYPGCVI